MYQCKDGGSSNKEKVSSEFYLSGSSQIPNPPSAIVSNSVLFSSNRLSSDSRLGLLYYICFILKYKNKNIRENNKSGTKRKRDGGETEEYVYLGIRGRDYICTL